MPISGNPTALTAVARAHSEPARREDQCTTGGDAAQPGHPATIQPHARVVKQVDTRDLKFLERELIPVRVRSRAPSIDRRRLLPGTSVGGTSRPAIETRAE